MIGGAFHVGVCWLSPCYKYLVSMCAHGCNSSMGSCAPPCYFAPGYCFMRPGAIICAPLLRPAGEDKATPTGRPLKCCQKITYRPPHPFFPHKQEYFVF